MLLWIAVGFTVYWGVRSVIFLCRGLKKVMSGQGLGCFPLLVGFSSALITLVGISFSVQVYRDTNAHGIIDELCASTRWKNMEEGDLRRELDTVAKLHELQVITMKDGNEVRLRSELSSKWPRSICYFYLGLSDITGRRHVASYKFYAYDGS